MDISEADRTRFSDTMREVLTEMEPVCQEEQNFITNFFHLTGMFTVVNFSTRFYTIFFLLDDSQIHTRLWSIFDDSTKLYAHFMHYKKLKLNSQLEPIHEFL